MVVGKREGQTKLEPMKHFGVDNSHEIYIGRNMTRQMLDQCIAVLFIITQCQANQK